LIFASYGNLASRLALGSLMILTIIGLLVHSKIKDDSIPE